MKWETFSIRALQILPKVNAVAYSGIKKPVRDQGSIYLVYILKNEPFFSKAFSCPCFSESLCGHHRTLASETLLLSIGLVA